MRFIYADDDTDVNGQTMLSSSSSKNRNSMIFGLLDRSSCVKNDPYFVIKHVNFFLFITYFLIVNLSRRKLDFYFYFLFFLFLI